MRKNRNKGLSLIESVVSLILASIMIMSLMTVTTLIDGNSRRIATRQEINVANINKIEELQYVLNTSGQLTVGKETIKSAKGYKKLTMEVTIDGSAEDGVYTVKLMTKLNGTQSRESINVIIARSVGYEK